MTASVAPGLIADARSYATTALTNAMAEMNYAMSVLGGLGGGRIVTGGVKLDVKPPIPGVVGDAPVYTGDKFTRRDFEGTRPDIESIKDLVLPSDPGAVPSVLGFNAPTKPTDRPDPSLIGSAPALNDLQVPPTPDMLGEISRIIAPKVLDITLPDSPTVVMPEFQGVRPLFDVTMPTDLDVTLRDQYATISPVMRDAVTAHLDSFMDREFPQFRSGMAAIESRLATYLAGGTALSPDIENAISTRAIGKNNSDAMRAAQDSWGKAARGGFTIPGATLLSMQRDIDQDRRNNNSRTMTEVAIEQAKLEQSNLQFAVTQSTNLRQMAISAGLSYYSGLVQLNGQALEYARSVLDAIVKAFDIAARYAETQARLYETEARVFDSKLKAALAVVDIYVAKIKGLEAQVEVNNAQVNVYKARLEAVQSEAAVYRASIDAVLGQAQIERSKVDNYQARVQAYAARVNAYTAEWQGYEAAVRGEVGKISASAEQVKAFAARVQAYESEVRARATEVDAHARNAEAKLNVYKTDIEAFTKLNEAEALAIRAEVDGFGATVQAFIAKATAVNQHSQSEIAAYEAGMRALIAAAELNLSELRETNKLNISRVEGTARVATAAGNIFSGVAQSALSGMNMLAAEVVELQG